MTTAERPTDPPRGATASPAPPTAPGPAVAATAASADATDPRAPFDALTAFRAAIAADPRIAALQPEGLELVWLPPSRRGEHRAAQERLWRETALPPLVYRDREVATMTAIVDRAEREGRLTAEEARTLVEGLDYIRGIGMGL